MRRVSVEQFSTLVSGIYDAAVDASLWSTTIGDVVATFGGGCGALLVNTRQARQALHASVGQDHASVASYNAYYGRMDPFALAAERLQAGSVFCWRDVVTPEQQRRSEFCNDWTGPNDIGDGVFANLARDGDEIAWLAIGTTVRSGACPDRDRMQLMRLLLPHLQQALRVQSNLGAIRLQQRGASNALDCLAHGVVLFDRGGSVLFANRAAANMAASGDGLTIGRTGVRAALPHEDAALQRLIGRASGKDGSLRAGGTLALTRLSARQPFVVHVLPTNAGEDELPMSGALAVIVDPEREPPALAAMLRRIYGLTQAEAAVACEVLRGDGLQSVADKMAVSLSTVRIHLQRVFEKTHTHRQAELTRLLLTIEAGVGPADSRRLSDTTRPRRGTM